MTPNVTVLFWRIPYISVNVLYNCGVEEGCGEQKRDGPATSPFWKLRGAAASQLISKEGQSPERAELYLLAALKEFPLRFSHKE